MHAFNANSMIMLLFKCTICSSSSTIKMELHWIGEQGIEMVTSMNLCMCNLHCASNQTNMLNFSLFFSFYCFHSHGASESILSFPSLPHLHIRLIAMQATMTTTKKSSFFAHSKSSAWNYCSANSSVRTVYIVHFTHICVCLNVWLRG